MFAPLASFLLSAALAAPAETLDRGLVALAAPDGSTYISWRLLPGDAADAAFLVERVVDGQSRRITAQAVTGTTDLVDAEAPKSGAVAYRLIDPQGKATEARRLPQAYQAIALPAGTTVQKIGIADLDGDGRLDYVLKTPQDNIDPYDKYWKRSPDSYKLAAFRHDGAPLWTFDLGWSIERGIWYSPYVAYDLDGDGRAEVAAKTGEGDPRDAEGKVQSGPERCSVLDGRSGAVAARVDWPSRAAFTGKGAYNYASRNQLGVARLDGKHPSLIVARGTYNYMTAAAYAYRDGKLVRQWQWQNDVAVREQRGQGAHWMHCADIDGDGRDEVLLGSIVLDDDGSLLWTTGLGHPDSFYLGDVDPERPGLEIYYNIETRNKQNAMCLVEAASGKILWGHPQPTIHIHASGMCSDIDPRHAGSECYGGERDDKAARWLRSAKGEVLSQDDMGLSPRTVYWDADPQRELIAGGTVKKHGGDRVAEKIEGSFVAVADVLGDWREEIITSLKGELRIYVSPLPARDRRACLLSDPIYRNDVAHAAMGYYQCPMLSYDLASRAKK